MIIIIGNIIVMIIIVMSGKEKWVARKNECKIFVIHAPVAIDIF